MGPAAPAFTRRSHRQPRCGHVHPPTGSASGSRWAPSDTELDLRTLSATGATRLTGYYRPEDIDIDRAALASGQVRWCGKNTGNEIDKIATLNDLNAEWTGGIFDATGKRLFVSVQHNVTGLGVVLEVTGWK